LPATIRDVARASGVHISTVSRTFSAPHMVNPETRSRVLATAETLGYRPNRAARALITGRTHNIGLIVADIANPFFPPLIRHVQNLAQDRGLTVLLADTDEQPGREEAAVALLSHQVEGLMLCSSRLPSTVLRRLAQQHRLVLVNRDVYETARVLLDTGPAVREAVTRLAELGHRRVVYLAGPQPRSWSNSQRSTAVHDQAAQLGLALVSLPTAHGTYEDGYALAAPVRAAGATAVLAFDDILAHGVMGGLAALGAQVPGDVSVVGCDDVLATTTHPPLSTIAVDLRAVAEASMAMLLDSPGAQPSGRTLLVSRLVLRGTVGPAPGRRVAVR
jgi:LacI family transcriptional regulator